MTPLYALAQSCPPELRAEVADMLERICAAYPTDRGKRARALAEIADLLRAMQ